MRNIVIKKVYFNKAILVIIIFILFCFLITSGEDATSNESEFPQNKLGQASLIDDYSSLTFNVGELDSLFRSDDFNERVKAAVALGNNCFNDTSECLEMLIAKLNSEIENPLSDTYLPSLQVSITNYLKNEYCFNIYNLLLNGDDSLLIPYIENSDHELQDRLKIVLGLLGNEQIREDIRGIYLNNTDGEIRVWAIQVMNRYPDPKDIPVLKIAIDDPYFTLGRFNNKSWPIRGTAAGALINLGFSIERIGENYETWVIVKEPE